MKLYQYKPFNKNIIVSLINNRLWRSEPASFNDPYDCLANFVYSGNKEDWENFIKSNITDTITQNRMLSEILEEKDNFENRFNKGHKDSISNHLRVACFSRNYSNVLMWSHYADYHKGIVIGYQTIKSGGLNYLEVEDPEYIFASYNNVSNIPIMPVQYNKPINFDYNPLIQNEEELLSYVFSKGKVWSYEKEYRAIIKNTLGKSVKLGKETISNIYMGSKISFEDEYFIRNLIPMLNKNRINKINLYKMKLSNSNIQLRPCLIQ
jgi:hypothetical protein